MEVIEVGLEWPLKNVKAKGKDKEGLALLSIFYWGWWGLHIQLKEFFLHLQVTT